MVSAEKKRWIVVGIAIQVAAPVLRNCIKQGMDKHYTNLDAYCSHLTTPCTLKTLTHHQVNADPNLKNLKFQNVNNNYHVHGKNRSLYTYNINSSVDLAKLYLPDYLAQFSAFDDSLDMTAILRLLGFNNYVPVAIFSLLTQTSADDVRESVRNKWGHFDTSEWSEAFFNDCFDKLEALVRSLGLTAGVEKSTLDQLNDWKTKGTSKIDLLWLTMVIFIVKYAMLIQLVLISAITPCNAPHPPPPPIPSSVEPLYNSHAPGNRVF